MIGLSYGNFQAVTTAPFSFGNALQFDGVDDFVSLSVDLGTRDSDFGFSCWFKSSDASFISNRMANPFVGLATSQWTSSVGLNGGKIATVSFSGSVNYNEGTNNYADGNWHCLTINVETISAGVANISAWVDGVLEINAGNYNIGGFNYRWENIGASRPTEKYNGYLDEMIFYRGFAVGLTEHEAFYNNGLGALGSDVFTPFAFYRMNGKSGDSTAIDETGNYNGTLNNFNTSTCWVAH